MSVSNTVVVRVPSQLRACCDGAATVSASGASVRDVLAEIGRRWPALYRSVCDETGTIRRHVNVFVNTANTRDRDGLDTAVAPGDEVSILPAVSGG